MSVRDKSLNFSFENLFNPDHVDIASIELVPFDDGKWSPFPRDCLPPQIEIYCNEVATYFCVDEALVKAMALAVLSSACQHYTLIIKDKTAFDSSVWETNLNLYVMLMAERGEKKSPIAKVLTKPIYSWEKEYNRKIAEKIKTEKAEYGLLKARQKRVEKDANKEQTAEADNELRQLNEQIESFEFTNPIQMVVDDATSEALGVVLADNQGVGTVISCEGGLLDIWSGEKYGHGVTNVDIPLKAYSGESFRVNRKQSASLFVEHPILAILLCIQSVVLKDFIENKKLTGKGTVDRFLFATPKSSIGNAKFYSQPVSAKADTDYFNTIKRMLDTRYDVDGCLNELTIKMSSEAEKTFARWHDDFQAGIRENLIGFEGWASKHVEAVARISGIFQVVEDASKDVSEENVRKAIILSGYFQEQVKIALCGNATDTNVKDSESLLKRMLKVADRKLDKHDGELFLTSKELVQECKLTSCKKRDEFNILLNELLERGMIATPFEEAQGTLRTKTVESSTKFFINPKLL